MTTLEEKKKAISEIESQQIKLVSKIKELANKKPSKSVASSINNAIEVVNIALHARQLEVQKYIIAATPIPKYKNGGIENGLAIVGEVGPEIIIRPR